MNPKLWQLIDIWIKDHPVLSQHFKVLGPGESTAGLNPGIYYNCASLKGIFDATVEILDNAVEIFDVNLKRFSPVFATDPEAFALLERQLYLMHDRSSEYNRDPCVRLHPCPKNKAFCGC